MKAERVLILESNEAFANELKEQIASRAGWEVCGATGSGEEGINLLKNEDPDIVILSLFLKGFDGFTVMEEAKPFRKRLRMTMSGSSSS